MEVLKAYADIFATNHKAVAACRETPMRLELKNPNSAPYVAPIRRYTPEQRKVIQTELEKLHKVRAVVFSARQYASCYPTARKKDGTFRVVRDFRRFNALFNAGDLRTS